VRHLIKPWDEDLKVKRTGYNFIFPGVKDGYLNLIFFAGKKLNFLSTEFLKL
jgi:hypothetical protein